MSKNIKRHLIYRIDHVPGAEIPEAEEYGTLQTLEEYDERGNLTLETGYTRDGEVGDKSEFVYDASDRVIESRIYGEDGDLLERAEMVRDQDGRLIQELVHYLDGSMDTRSYFYDQQGNLTGMEVKDEEDELDFSERYFYEAGHLVKIERFDEENETVFYQEDEYENGVLAHRKVWSSEEEEPFTLVTEFNDRGHRVKETRYDSRDKVIERNVYEEDADGRICRLIEENRLRRNTTEFSFDGRGNIVYQKETDLNGELNHEVFRTFDDDGKPLMVTVEMIQKHSGEKRAYTLVYRYEYYDE